MTQHICTHLMWGCNILLFKCYGIHSNKVLNKYFYYNPRDFVWMSRVTDTPACEVAVSEIKQQLECDGDLDFWDLLNDKVVYIQGYWIPLGDSNGTCNKEEDLTKLAWDAMQLHSMLEAEWLLTTTAIDKGTNWCHDRLKRKGKSPSSNLSFSANLALLKTMGNICPCPQL